MKITKSCREFRASAKQALTGQWGDAAITTLVYVLIIGVFSTTPLVGLLSFFLIPVLLYGYMIYFLNICRGEKMTLRNLFDGFQNYVNVTFTYLLMYIYVLLWSLLFIIPGIIKIFSYALTLYIVKDYGLRYNEAIELSMKMMHGNKWKLFLLCLSFIGWLLLAALTLGIGLLWLNPYISTSMSMFYLEVKEKYELEQSAI